MQTFSGSYWRKSITHSNKEINQERRRYGIQETGTQLRKEAKGIPKKIEKGDPWMGAVQQGQNGADEKVPRSLKQTQEIEQMMCLKAFRGKFRQSR